MRALGRRPPARCSAPSCPGCARARRNIMSPKVTRRQFLEGLAGLAGAALLAGCGAGVAPTASPIAATPVGGAAPSPTGRRQAALLRFAWWTDVGPLTPFQVSTTGPGGVALLSLVFDTLTWKDAQGVIPWLAKSWQAAPDG